MSSLLRPPSAATAGAVSASVLVACVLAVLLTHGGKSSPDLLGNRAGSDVAPKSQATATSESNGTVVIDTRRGVTFTPTSESASLTAEEAYARYASLLGADTVLPAAEQAHLGRVTIPIGAGTPEQYLAKDQLTWAFTSHQCPPSTLPSPDSATPGPCIEWVFLDAETGREIQTDWQQ